MKYKNVVTIVENLSSEETETTEQSENSKKPVEMTKAQEIKKKADEIRAYADLVKAKAKLKVAKKEYDKADEPEATFPRKTESSEEKAEQPVKDFDNEISLESGNPLYENLPLADSFLVEAEDDSDNEESDNEAQTKEEAEIEKIQAETDKIKKETENAEGDEELQDIEVDPNDPNADPIDYSQQGQIDPMTGMPQQSDPNDPLQGFGDETETSDPYGMGGGNIDPMTGMPMEGGDKKPSALGRVYMLKKIYHRLYALDRILSTMPDEEITELRSTVEESFEIFRMICNNLKTYKDKIDEIIIGYYQLIRDITTDLETFIQNKI